MRRRRRRSAPVKLILALIAIAAIALILFKFVFVIRHVTVNGAPDYDANEIIRVSGIRMNDPLLSVSAPRVAERIDIDGRLIFVSVERHLPSTVVLNLQQRQKAAVTAQGAHMLILDADGHVLEIIDDVLPDSDLPYITGLDLSRCAVGEVVQTTTDRLNVLTDLLHLFQEKNILHSVSNADLTDPDTMMLTLRNGLNIKLGDGENLSVKLDLLICTVNDMFARGEGGGTLDISSGTKADYAP